MTRHVGYVSVEIALLESLLGWPRGSVYLCTTAKRAEPLRIYIEHPSLPFQEIGKPVPRIGDATLQTLDPAPPIDEVRLLDSEHEREVGRLRFSESLGALRHGLDDEETLP